MGQQSEHSKEFRDAIIKKLLSRGSRTIAEVCDEVGISHKKGANWIYRRGTPLEMKKNKKSNNWRPEQKLKALNETSLLNESDLGVYLRKEGLYSNQLQEWKQEFLAAVTVPKAKKNGKDQRDEKIKLLEREILRKDKALAEATALLILQKKVNLIWGNNDEDEK